VGGRPKTDKKTIDKAQKLYLSQTHSIKEITAICGISQATLYRELRKIPKVSAM
jgi:transposase